jgi:uncharacterized protein YegL
MQLVTQKEFYLQQHDVKGLIKLFTNTLPTKTPVTVGQMQITDEVAENMDILPNSWAPAAQLVGRKLVWDFSTAKTAVNKVDFTGPITVSYTIKPQEPGTFPVSDMARADWTDTISRTGSVRYPDVNIEVIPPPTPTPTYTPVPTNTPTATNTPVPTNTPTATFTPTPQAAYLPYVMNQINKPEPTPACRPEVAEVDVIALIDTSDSMGEVTPSGKTKLEEAIVAVQELVDALVPANKASNAHIAIIGFNSKVSALADLTNDRLKLATALAGLPATRATGTYIDRGLTATAQEFANFGRPTSKRHVVLVTDGRQQNGDAQAVLNAAASVKALNATVWTIGLGLDVDQALLVRVATDANHFASAPTAADLKSIYQNIAVTIPCP